jgi:NDP-sugar pyrophosphorylase family protein
MKVVILAGGKGTRLNLKDIPKPMLKIKGKPMLERIIANCVIHGFKDIILKTGYGHDVIAKHFGSGKKFGCNITYLQETVPLGTAGGLTNLCTQKEPVFILFGDVLNEVDMVWMLDSHIRSDAKITIATQNSTHPEDADVLEIDSITNRILKTHHKPGDKRYGSVTNAAMYILEPEVFNYIPLTGVYDFGRDLIPLLLLRDYPIYSYFTKEWLFDVGTPERVIEAGKHYE